MKYWTMLHKQILLIFDHGNLFFVCFALFDMCFNLTVDPGSNPTLDQSLNYRLCLFFFVGIALI